MDVPSAASHGSALLGLLFAIKAWSYGLDPLSAALWR